MSRKSRPEATHVEFTLTEGTYVLTEDWTHDFPDKRLSGYGLDTTRGFRKGTRFLVERAGTDEEPWRGLELTALFLSYSACRGVHGTKDGTRWFVDPSTLRLLRALEPDLTTKTWLDHEMGVSYGCAGWGHETLLELLETGKLTREQIRVANASVLARVEEKNDR